MLRDYQLDIIKQTLGYLHEGYDRVCLQMPTGAGKTLTTCEIVSRAVAQGRQVIFMAHRTELIIQSGLALEKYLGIGVGVIKAGHPVQPHLMIHVASVQTLSRRDYTSWLKPGLLVIDECHLAIAEGYRKVIATYKPRFILGLTATPCRLDNKPLRDLFQAIAHGPQVSDLIERGHLSKYRLFAAPHQIDTKSIKTQNGDYKTSELADAAMHADIVGDVFESWRKFAHDKQTIVFCVNVRHSQMIEQEYRNHGVSVAHLDGTIDSNIRKRTLDKFRSGEIKILTNCQLFCEGLDIPGIEAVQIIRPTKSIALYLQQIGRALRPAPGKDAAIIIDHTNNWQVHGLPDDPRIWTLEAKPETKKKCTERNDQGEITGVQGEVVSIEERIDPTVQLIEVLKTTGADQWFQNRFVELAMIAEKKGYKKQWVIYKLNDEKPLSIPDLRLIGRCFGYKPKWAEYMFEKINSKQLELV